MLVDAPERSPAPEPRSRIRGSPRWGWPGGVGVPGRLWRMASGTRPSCWRRGSNSFRREVFHAHQYGGYAVAVTRRLLVHARTASQARLSPRARPYPPSRVSLPRWDGWYRAWPPCCSYGASRPRRAKCLQLRLRQQTTRRWRSTKRWSRSWVSPPTAPGSRHPTYVVRAPTTHGATGGPPRLSREGASRPAARWRAVRVPIRGARLPRHPRTATKPGSSVGPPPSLHAAFWDDSNWTDAWLGAPTFSTALIHDPRFDEPLLLNTSLPLTGATCRPSIASRPVEGVFDG